MKSIHDGEISSCEEFSHSSKVANRASLYFSFGVENGHEIHFYTRIKGSKTFLLFVFSEGRVH